MDLQFIGAGIALISLAGVALALGNVFVGAISAVSRNPASKDNVQFFMFLGAAFTEVIGLLAVVVALLMVLN